jgi:hypothetical protein
MGKNTYLVITACHVSSAVVDVMNGVVVHRRKRNVSQTQVSAAVNVMRRRVVVQHNVSAVTALLV